MEIRSFGNTASPQIGNESRTIEGYAIVFGQESEVLFDKNQISEKNLSKSLCLAQLLMNCYREVM